MHNRQLLASMALQAYLVNREAQNILRWQFVSLVIALKLSHEDLATHQEYFKPSSMTAHLVYLLWGQYNIFPFFAPKMNLWKCDRKGAR